MEKRLLASKNYFADQKWSLHFPELHRCHLHILFEEIIKMRSFFEPQAISATFHSVCLNKIFASCNKIGAEASVKPSNQYEVYALSYTSY